MNHVLTFGEVLFDAFEDGTRVLGGAPFNVTWHLQAFGATPHFVTRIGEDDDGQSIREAMARWGLTLDGVQVDPTLPTGQVTVKISDGEPSYDIVRPAAWDEIDTAAAPHGAILYHGTLATRNSTSRTALSMLRDSHDGIVFVDVNLRDPWWNRTQVLDDMRRAHWVKLNHDEMVLLGGELPAHEFVEEFELDGLILTHGARGATLLTADGTETFATPSPAKSVVDVVGAGDAFASVVLLGLLHDWSIEQTAKRAQAFASAVVGQRGATISDKAFYRTILASFERD